MTERFDPFDPFDPFPGVFPTRERIWKKHQNKGRIPSNPRTYTKPAALTVAQADRLCRTLAARQNAARSRSQARVQPNGRWPGVAVVHIPKTRVRVTWGS